MDPMTTDRNNWLRNRDARPCIVGRPRERFELARQHPLSSAPRSVVQRKSQ